MESEAQKVEAMKKNAKYRRHVMKKRKHERNMAQAREHEDYGGYNRNRSEFDSQRLFAPAAKLKKVTSGRLSVPRGLFLKGRASSILKKTGDTYLNPLNYARKKEKLGQIIKIGMDQAQKIDNQSHAVRKSNQDLLKRLPKGTEVTNNKTEGTQEAKRKKNVDRIKTVLGLADPAPSFIPSPLVGAQDTQFAACSIPTPERPLVNTMSHEKSESPRRAPYGFDSSRDVSSPERVPPQQSCGMLEAEEKVDEMDDLFLEKLVSDIGLYAWNSQKPGSEPYENCDDRLIKEIISLRDVSLTEIAKCNKAKKSEHPKRVSETITSLPPGLQKTPNSVDFKLAACDDEGQSHWVPHNQTTERKVRLKTVTALSDSVEYDAPDECCRGLLMGKAAETHTSGTEDTDDEPPGMMPLPADTNFVSPSTPPIAVHAFDPKAFMQHVEVQQRPQENLNYPESVGCSIGGGCGISRPFDRAGSSRHFHRSEDECNADEYETALSQCGDAEVSGTSDDSDVSCNLYKYRRAMY